MYKQLDEFLVTQMPRIWRSRLLFMVPFTLVLLLAFSTLEGTGFLENDGDSLLVFIPVIAAFYWLYTQNKHQPFLRRFSLWEVFIGSLLNLFCLGLLVLPFFFLRDSIYGTYGEGSYQYIHSVYNIIPFVAYAILLPSVFIAFVIRSYSASETLILVIAFLAFGAVLIFITESFSIGGTGDSYLYIFCAIYLATLVKISGALIQRRYGSWDKRLIFLLMIGAPWFVSGLYAIFMGAGDARYLIPDAEFFEDSETHIYFYCGIATFIFLLLLTWYVTRSYEKPMRVK